VGKTKKTEGDKIDNQKFRVRATLKTKDVSITIEAEREYVEWYVKFVTSAFDKLKIEYQVVFF